MSKLHAVLGSCAAMLLAVPANAAVLTYNLSGSFADGSTLGGSFSFDDAGTSGSQFSGINVLITGPTSFASTRLSSYGGSAGVQSSRPYVIGFGSGMRTVFITLLADYDRYALRTIVSSDIVTSSGTSYLLTSDSVIRLQSGTVTLATDAVPEPATWAMMLVGFGMIGAASRYGRRGTNLTSA